MNCLDHRVIHTIGHSTRSIDKFIALLQAHEIARLIDVRRWPMSRRHPHFNREALAVALESNGIDYQWRRDLGGFRKAATDSPNTAWRVTTFRAYADFMLTDDFSHIAIEVEKLAEDRRSAFMCAEAVPWRCHRQLLADAFLVRRWDIRHIMDVGCYKHTLPDCARVEQLRITYSGNPKDAEGAAGRLF